MIDVKRTAAAPEGLAKGLREHAVLEALHRDFLEKCYLCETPVTIGGFEVDHRVPQSHDPARALDWSNLFPICDGCNKRRRKKCPDGGLLDPASGAGDIAARLEQRIIDHYPIDTKPGFRALDAADVAACNTAEELDHIHNDPGSIKAAVLRDAIVRHQRRVFRKCMDYRNVSLAETKRRELADEIRRMVSRRAPFTALTRAELAACGPDIVALFDEG